MSSDSNPDKKIVVGALGLPINKQGEYLLTRRNAPGIQAWHNKWQITGGALEFGETIKEALLREIYEELRVKPKIINPHPIVKTGIWYAHETSFKFDAQIVLICYLLDIGKQKVDISKDNENNKFGWFTLKEIKKLDKLPLSMEIVEEAEKIVHLNNLLR